jgi:DNA-directed RNA polymerase subunit RPC12/RpoP
MGLFKKMKETASQYSALQQQAQVYAAAQGYGPDGQPLAPDAPRPQLDPSAFLPPASEFVKRTKCAFCGAPKMLPSVREYLYCDYCGQLVDFDLRQAMANAHTNPDSTAYAQQANQVGPAAAQALQAGDRERYRQLQYQLYDLQTAYTKWAVPPRAWNDEGYRSQWVRYNAEQAVANSFDPAYQRLDADMRNLALSLRWRGGNMMKMAMGAMGGGQSADAFPKVEPASLWPLIDVMVAQSARSLEVAAATGVRELDPDQMPQAVIQRMTPSSIAQAYLRFLEPDEGLELISRLAISHEFVHPEVVGDQKACGGCGGTLTLVPGATKVVCNGCGRRVDVGAGELPCTGCGATMCLPEGVDQQGCPYCRALVRRT